MSYKTFQKIVSITPIAKMIKENPFVFFLKKIFYKNFLYITHLISSPLIVPVFELNGILLFHL